MVCEPVEHRGRVDATATAACLGALCSWAIGPLFIKYLTGHIDSWTQNALRYSVACLFWLPFLLHQMWRGTFDHRTWRRAIGPAAANLVMQSLWAKAFYYGEAGFLVLLSKTSILWVTAFSLLFFPDERPLARSKRFWTGLGLSVAGVSGVLYFKEDFQAAGTTTGILIVLFGAVLWGVYTISVKVAFRDTDSRSGFSVISLYTTVGLWIAALVSGEPAQALTMGVGPWMGIVVSGITAIALGHVFFYSAIRRIGATIPMLVILAQPLVVFAVSSVAFNERLTGLQLLFGLVLLAGAAVSVWAQQHLRARAQDSAGPLGRSPCHR